MKLKLQVTAQDIRNGVPDKPLRCPIAQALISNGYTDHCGYPLRVGLDSIVSANGLIGTMPKHIASKIKRFDSTGQMSPFTFTITHSGNIKRRK